jgi:heme/copper-type cytochrome/quinol oxidase subunit 3
MGLLAGMLPAGRRHKYDVRYAARLQLAGMFWHFVGIVWVVMFLSMYVA